MAAALSPSTEPKLPCPSTQHVAEREILGHVDDRVIDRGVAVGWYLPMHVADDTGRFLVGLVPVVAEFVHGEQRPGDGPASGRPRTSGRARPTMTLMA